VRQHEVQLWNNSMTVVELMKDFMEGLWLMYSGFPKEEEEANANAKLWRAELSWVGLS